MMFQIKSWLSGRVLFECEAANFGFAVEKAVKAGADLTGARLSGADLTGARLSGARLTNANLTGADMSGANLTSANLTGARLSGARLTNANLTGADMSGADLAGANLTSANLRGADLTGANLRGADLTGADLTGANLLEGHEVPLVEDLDAKILAAVEDAGSECGLDMTRWHETDACGTTHCRAGWAVHLAGEAGRALEEKLGPQWAGGLIYLKATGRIPNFFASDRGAMADMLQAVGRE